MNTIVTAVLFWLLVSAISTVVIWWGSQRLEQSSQTLASYYGMPSIVRGAVIAAVGSSFPELSTTILSTLLHGKFNLGVGAIVGSAVFNLLVIPAVSGIDSGGINASRTVVYKEAQFYMIAGSALLITFSFAVIYFPVDGPHLKGTMNRPLALIPIGLYCIYIFTQYHDISDHVADESSQSINIYMEWLRILFSMFLIAIAVEGLLKSAVSLGEIFETPDFLWGLTVIAAGTSLPDTFISVQSARDGEADASLSNVLGSNTFDLLIAIPAGVLIAGESVINFSAAIPMLGFLTLATVIVFVLMRIDLQLSVRDCYGLLLTYAVFLTWIFLETFDVMNIIPGK